MKDVYRGHMEIGNQQSDQGLRARATCPPPTGIRTPGWG